MKDIKVTIDGIQVQAREDLTILQVAELVGIHIPTLCHAPDLKPSGVCRICVVEVEGQKTLAGACHTPVSEGMVIHTRSHKVIEARKVIVELLLTAHTGSCVTDINARECSLHNLASEMEVGPPRFQVRAPRSYPVEDQNPYVRRDLSKCILCRRCVSACRELAQKNIFSIGYRGFQSKIIVDFDGPLDKEVCRDCGICIDYCPTGALSKANHPEL
jgi:NADH dehydrogenase/NADH:ubiquinone oxidoreductase subunit G